MKKATMFKSILSPFRKITTIRLWGSNINNTAVILTVSCLVTAVMLGVFTAYSGSLVFGFALGVIGGLLLFLRPEILPVFLPLYIWLLQGRADPGDILESVSLVRWITYIAIPIVLLRAITDVVLRRRMYRTPIDIPLLATIFIIGLAGIINHDYPQDIVFAIGVYLRYPLLFWALVNLNINSDSYRHGLWVIIFASLLSIPESLIAWSVGRTSDSATWIFGPYGTAPLGFFIAVTQSVIISWGLLGRWRWYHTLLVTLLFIPAFIGTIRALFILVPVIFISVLFWIHTSGTKRRVLSYSILLILVIGIVILIAFPITKIFNSGVNAILTQPWIILGVADNPGDNIYQYEARLRAIQFVLGQMIQKGEILFGWGVRSFNPGSINVSSVGEGIQFLADAQGAQPGTEVVVGSQWVRSLGEIGLIGTLSYLLMLIPLFIMNRNMWQLTKDKHWRIILTSFFAIWLIYAVVAPWYNDVWRIDAISAPFWLFAAAIFSHWRQNFRNETKS